MIKAYTITTSLYHTVLQKSTVSTNNCRKNSSLAVFYEFFI